MDSTAPPRHHYFFQKKFANSLDRLLKRAHVDSRQRAPALVHLRVPREKKLNWQRASRARGQKLTAYIEEAVDEFTAKHTE